MLLLAAMQLGDMLFAAAIAAISVTLLLRIVRRRRQAAARDARSTMQRGHGNVTARVPSGAPLEREQGAVGGLPPHSLKEIPDAVVRWEIYLHEAGRQTAAEIDTKLRVLQAMTGEADRAARRLEQAIQAAAPEPASGSSPPTDCPPSEPLSSDRAVIQREFQHVLTLWDYGFDVPDIASRTSLAESEVVRILRTREDA